ncbi:uncharacterized protein LOC101166422 isoform X1 [Oryzias latipes]|uniref:Mitogen-activated protein kinase kinase kinase 14 n=1 Tax=Oryzias latipes TaxID=8090 RepID=H2MGG7_ORYLA|nr:uncharacterized protein LOC101166422 isoform X1 [Oryzias latipes]
MFSDTEVELPQMSHTSLVLVTDGSELSCLGKEGVAQRCKEKEEPLGQACTPPLSLVMQRGTARHVVPEGFHEDPCVSIVVQAEREDFQEFSPSNTRCSFSQSRLLSPKPRSWNEVFTNSTDEEDPSAPPPQRRQCRRTRNRRRRQEEGEEPPIIRGLWVQEIDWLKATSAAGVIPPPPQFTDPPPCCHGNPPGTFRGCVCGTEEAPQRKSVHADGSDNRGGSDSDWGSINSRESQSDSSCVVEEDDLGEGPCLELLHVSGFEPSPHAGWDSDSTEWVPSPLGTPASSSVHSSVDSSQSAVQDDPGDGVLDELRGKVRHISKFIVSAFLRASMKDILNDWKTSAFANQGLLFHRLLRPSSCQYRECEEYSVLHHIQNGSYGDVFCVRDRSTGFQCAAKRIPLSHFHSGEVSSWSALNSPRVVELFGVVREGPNVVLFMELKQACLGQLLRQTTCLPEDLALHYLHQTLEALEHLHNRKVLHLDVKADNVLLSADCRDTFLCDFGLSETLEGSGWSSKAVMGAAFPGTESHMAPEVAGGDRLSAKADVWSSCCMLLHMLNGCQPWIRCYSHPLCVQIVNEPPPLWEVPSNCNNFTAKVFKAGLQKDPERRASSKELRRKTTKALRAVGGLSPSSIHAACEKLLLCQRQDDNGLSVSSSQIPVTKNRPSAPLWVSPWRTLAGDEDSSLCGHGSSDQHSDVETDSVNGEWESYPDPLQEENRSAAEWDTGSESDIDIYMGEEEFLQNKCQKTDRDYEGDCEEERANEEEEEEEEEEEWDSSASVEHPFSLRDLFPLLQKGQKRLWGSEEELEYLRNDIPVGTTIQCWSPEPRDEPPSCFSCSDTSQMDASENDSDHSSDDLSSGVFSSCNRHSDGLLEWRAADRQRSSCCFEGVDVWIENMQGECLRIRESRQVNVGHVAVGISDQIWGKAFTLESLDRKLVPLEEKVKVSGLWLRCVPAPDGCQRWKWRVRDGKLELRD